jgi:glycosyltransferase involved in cell wall biosynthesis
MNGHFKIAMVAACPFPYPRGTPIRIFRMAEALAHRGNEVHVVTYHLGEKLQKIPFYLHRIGEVKTYRKYSPGPTYQKLLVLDTLLCIKLYQVLKSRNIDLIHAHHYEGLVVASLGRRWTKYPLIYDAHTLLQSELPFYQIGLPQIFKRSFGLYLDRRLPKLADHIISVTSGIRDKLIAFSGISEEHISVAANGVDHTYFQKSSNMKQGVKRNVKMMIYTGNLGPFQGIDLMLKAFQIIIAHRQDVRLLLISNDDFVPYKDLVNQLGIQNYIDFQNSVFADLPNCFAAADIALNPRVNCDGIPQKLLNYMAAGKPVVSFGGSAKTLEHGETGWVVEDYNIEAFARGVIHLLENQEMAKKIGENAAKCVASDYSWKKTAEKVEVVYQNLLARV